jgi:hypothetical protein
MAELRVKGTGTIKLFESDNTSSVTIASPASLGGDRTITLPDGDVTLTTGTMPVLTGSTNNTVVTVTGADAIAGEANLTYDGSTLTVKPGSNVHQLKLEQNNATDYWSLHADSSGGPLSFNRYTGGAETERLSVASLGDATLTGGDLIFGTAGKGVCLGVTTNTDANTLDDYEEGTWTAQDTDGGGSNQFGMYTKIGNLVTCQFSLTTGAISGSDIFYITNLPFTVGGTDAFRGPVTIAYTNATTMILAGNVVESSTTAYLLIGTGDIATDAEIGASKVIAAAIIYRV